ncbi:MAG TPA: hypothetical protein VFA17_06310 [Thermoplasmata archaeon]|nr:hypothetical protein [Thermoplasmata archaeon]
MSGYLRDNQLRRQLEEKVKEAARTRQAAEDSLKAAQDIIDQARRVDANVVEAERVLAEASGAMSAKEYKAAAEKAAEAFERGKRIYRDRARSIVDSSADLARLAKGVGADLADTAAALAKAEGALASDDLGSAIDLAKKAWKRSEKILQEHLSSSFSKAQSLILSAKNLNRSVAPIEDLLSRARTAMENNDFQSALDFTKEGLDTITEDLTSALTKEIREAEDLLRTASELGADTSKPATLIERARGDVGNLDFEKAKNTLNQSRSESEKSLQRSLDGRAGDFSRLAQEARAMGADPSAAQDLFNRAEAAIKKGSYREGAQLAKQGFQAVQQAQFQRVVAVIGTSREKFVAAANMGIDLKGPMDDMNAAREAIRRGAFQEALALAKRADSAVNGILDRYKAVETRLKELHRAFAEVEAFGVQTVRARKMAEAARQAYQERNPAEVERAIGAAFDELRRAERERVMESIERAEFVLTLGEQNGADLSEPSKMLQEAIVATKSEDFRRALDLSSGARAKAERTLAEGAARQISSLRTSLPHLGDESGALKALLNRADAAMASQDFEGAFKAVAEGQALVESKVRTRADEIVGDLALAVRMGVDLGANVASLEALHRDLNAHLASGRIAEIAATRESAAAALAQAADGLVNLVRSRIAAAQGLKLDVDEMNDFVRRARMAFGVQNYHEGLRLLNEAHERASKGTGMHRQAYTAIASAAAFVAEAKKRNVDVSKVVEMLVDAKKAFEQMDLERAIQLASAARAETDKLQILYSSAQKIMSSRSRMELADRLGIAAPHLREVFAEAKEAMKAKDYEKALALAQGTEDEFTALIRERVALSLDATEQDLASLGGMDLTTSKEALARARRHLETGEIEQAAEVSTQLTAQLESMRRQGSEAEEALKAMRDILADGEAMNAPLPRTSALVERAERAFQMGQFEEVLDYAAQADVEAAKERDQGIGELIRGFEEAIAKAKREGTDTRSAEKLLERAQELFRAKKYRQAIATALQSEAETERISLQQSMARKAVETAERKMGALGKGAPMVAELVGKSRKAFDDGDFVRALDTAVRATDLIADFRVLLDEVEEVRDKARTLLQTAMEIGADTSKFDRSVQEGESSLEAGEVEQARAAFAQGIEWGRRLLGGHLREEVAKAEGLVATCRKMEVDATSALNKLEEAKGLLAEERFADASLALTAAKDAANAAISSKLNRSLLEAADSVAHAKKLGSDSRAAEALLKEVNERVQRGEFDNAMDVVKNALERVESAKIVEKRFVDLTYKAETTIRNGRKFGIDMKAAEAKLDQAVRLRGTDFAEAMKAAEEAYRTAWDATEAFAPSMKGSIDIGAVRLNEWADGTLTVENDGKGAARDVRVRILGDAEVESLPEIPAVRAKSKEVVRLRLKPTASGSVPLAIQIVSHRVFDGKEYTQEMIAQIDVSEVGGQKAKRLVADLETRCPICKGLIKKGFKVTRCGCGRDFHELCATRVGRCPACFRGLHAAVE